MFKKELALILFIFILFLAACTGDTTTAGNVEQDQSDTDEVTNEDENKDEESIDDGELPDREEKIEVDQRFLSDLETISLIDSREGLKEQQGGKLVKDISIVDEVEDSSSKPLDSSQIIEIKEELEALVGHTQNPEELYKGIVYLLGSPNYQETIEKAESFEPEFEDPSLPDPGVSEDVNSEPENGKAIVLLDASSSMLLPVDGQVKMDIAKEAVRQFGESIGEDDDISLVVYGHKGSESESDKELSCNGIEAVYPMSNYDKAAFEQSLTTFESKGYTPLAEAIKKATEMSKDYTEPITLYIVSDGAESCDGDPMKEAEAFYSDKEDRIVNIIGFDVDKEAKDHLKQIAEAGNGSYYSADSAEELNSTIEEEWLPSYMDLAWANTKAPGPWEILDEYDRFDVDLNRIREIIKTEKSRYDLALQIMRVEGLVESDIIDELSDIVIEEYRVKLDLMSEFRTEKLEAIDQEAEEIRNRVDEWKGEMSQRTEEHGDLL